MKTLEQCITEIEKMDKNWDNNGLPGDLYFLAFAKLGLDFYVRNVKDSNVNAELGNRSIGLKIYEARMDEHKYGFKMLDVSSLA